MEWADFGSIVMISSLFFVCSGALGSDSVRASSRGRADYTGKIPIDNLERRFEPELFGSL